MKTFIACLLAPSLALAQPAGNHTIEFETTVHASPAEVFRLWTTAEGVKRFFAPAAKIEPRVGGAYTIIFAPEKDPEGNSLGTNGARILKFRPNEELSFEWIAFSGDPESGTTAPPFAPPAERNQAPLPTWVELTFAPVPGRPNETKLHFAHHGFRDGEKWQESYRWFTRAWKRVLDQLVASCDKEARS